MSVEAAKELTERQREVKARFREQRGTWSLEWESILRLDVDFLEAYLTFSTVPNSKNHLDNKTRELVFIAMNAAATHLYVPGIRSHIRAALDHGATIEEIMEVLELTSTLGIHAANIGVPLLVKVLAEQGVDIQAGSLSAEQERIKKEFVTFRGYWHEFWDGILALSPELLDAYTQFSAVPWKTGTLEPKIKELIYCAFDSAATHLYASGLELHIRNALTLGATPYEVMEVFEIVSVLGIHGPLVAAPILEAEAQQIIREKAGRISQTEEGITHD
ncbi:gamma-carboxymuconolactone decarboxylase [Rhodococcus sp. 06-621-2]|nr:carboxymuconolactone decarboxylase family protein [Rhodococcus sp. 06-621-2]OZC59744.1 gamma-carboxymuconolactone decarboxylase [Rhodococcus sp. 06-621-2]